MILWGFFFAFKERHQEISMKYNVWVQNTKGWGSVEMKPDKSWLGKCGDRVIQTLGPSYYSLHFCISDGSQNKKVKRKKTNNPLDLPFPVLVLGETPQQTLLLTDRWAPAPGYLWQRGWDSLQFSLKTQSLWRESQLKLETKSHMTLDNHSESMKKNSGSISQENPFNTLIHFLFSTHCWDICILCH